MSTSDLASAARRVAEPVTPALKETYAAYQQCERVAETDLWAEWERLRDVAQTASNRAWTSTKRTERELLAAHVSARSALDTFVCGLI